ATGSTDYLADLGIWMSQLLPGAAADPGAWLYDHFSLGTFRLAQAGRLHGLLAYLFMTVGLLYAIGLALGGGFKALLPRRSDLAGALAMLRYYRGVVPARLLRRPWPHPPVKSKYNPLQRIAYLAMPLLGVLAVASGWAMHKPVQLKWLECLFVNYEGARIIHFWTMVAFATFVIPHVVLVIADGWDTFRSMVTGWSYRIGGRHGREGASECAPADSTRQVAGRARRVAGRAFALEGSRQDPTKFPSLERRSFVRDGGIVW